MDLAQVLLDLTHAAEGLLYLSEADHPFAIFQQDYADYQIEFSPGTRVKIEHVPFEQFFAEFAEGASHKIQKRIARLRRAFDPLEDLRVLRVGGGSEIQIYLLGGLGDRVVGLRTVSVET